MGASLVGGAAFVALAVAVAGCDKKSEAAIKNAKETAVAHAPQRECQHSACADDCFVDTAPAGECSPGACGSPTLWIHPECFGTLANDVMV